MSVARVPIEPGSDLAVSAPALTRPGTAGVRGHGRVRRTAELVIATTLLVALLPVLLLIAVLVASTSEGPVIYRQRRVGIEGRTFDILKFRTMCADADERAAALFAVRDDGSGPLNKLRDDPRLTRVGRLLRRTSLDELPQLWNVLNGTMALVGPRPSRPQEVALFTELDRQRQLVRPGITGIAQVSGRSDLDWEDAVRLDLYYIEHRSLGLDLRILLRTLPAVLRCRGAY